MKRLFFVLAVALLAGFGSFAADPVAPTGTINLKHVDVFKALMVYRETTGLDLMVDSRVKSVRTAVTLRSAAPMPKADLAKFIEKGLVDQAGVVVTRLDDKRASVTYNDALTTKPGK